MVSSNLKLTRIKWCKKPSKPAAHFFKLHLKSRATVRSVGFSLQSNLFQNVNSSSGEKPCDVLLSREHAPLIQIHAGSDPKDSDFCYQTVPVSQEIRVEDEEDDVTSQIPLLTRCTNRYQTAAF